MRRLRPLAVPLAALLLAALSAGAPEPEQPQGSFALCKLCFCRDARSLGDEGDDAPPFLDVVCGDVSLKGLPELDLLEWPSIGNNREIHVVIKSLGRQTIPRLPKNEFVSILSFYNNDIKTIYPNAFADLTNLQQLSLASNELAEVTPDMFSSMGRLVELDLSDNKLSVFNQLDFKELVSLERILLQSNLLTNIPVEAFMLLPKLEFLDISNNQIYLLDFGAASPENVILSKLKFLDVSGNMLTIIVKDTFLSATSLEYLNLSNNKLVNIAPDVFKNCNSLKELDLSNNQLTSVASLPAGLDSLFLQHNDFKQWPATPQGLRIMDLSHNSIFEVYNENYLSLDSLQVLNISSNQIKIFDIQNPLKSLKVFDFSYNLLSEVPASVSSKVFPTLDDLYLDGNPFRELLFPKEILLKKLSVSHISEIKTIDGSALTHVHGRATERETETEPEMECIDIYISHCNKLSTISESAFHGIPLCHLDLSYNQISFLSEKMANWSSIIRGVNLQGNPWDCRCEMQWLLDVLLKDLFIHHPMYLHELRCDSPRAMKALRMVHWFKWGKKAFCSQEIEDHQSSNYYLLESEQNNAGLKMSSTTITILVIIAVALVAIMCLIGYLAHGHYRHNAAVRQKMLRKRQQMGDAAILNNQTSGQNRPLTQP